MLQPTSETPSPAARRVPPDALPRELFALFARNDTLLLIIGSVWALVGCLLLLGAAMIAFLSEMPSAFGRLFGAILFFYAALILTPAIHLLYYRVEVRKANAQPTTGALTIVLLQQKRFWRFVGLMVIAGLLLALFAVVAPGLL